MSCARRAKGSVKLRSPSVLCTYGSGQGDQGGVTVPVPGPGLWAGFIRRSRCEMRRRGTVHTRHQLSKRANTTSKNEHRQSPRKQSSSKAPSPQSSSSIFDGALDLLKRHSGIVWDPGRFAGLLRGGSVRGLGSPSSPPYFMGGVQARPSLVSRSGNA